MGKFDLYNKKTYNDELPENPMFSWKIFACQGHIPRVQLINTVETRFTEHGFNLEVEEPNRLVFKHPDYENAVEISFGGEVTTTNCGTYYRLCVHSESHTLTIEDESKQKELYDLVFSVIPPTWGKESYRIEDHEEIPVKKRRFRLKQKIKSGY